MDIAIENEKTEFIRAQWEAAAEGWDAQTTAVETWLVGPTATMLEMAGVTLSSCALDVAAGAGGQTLVCAARVGPAGRIVATDIASASIERLRHNARSAGFKTIEGRVADAQLPLAETDNFDAAICRLGLMLMPDPARCLIATSAALKPGARFSAIVFAGPEANPCIRILMATALRHAGLPPRDPFAPGGLLSLGRPGDLDRLFEVAGFREVSTFRIEAPFRMPAVDDYMDFVRTAAAPVLAVLSPLTPAAREAAWQDIRQQLDQYSEPGAWVGPNTLLLTTGMK